MTNIKAFDSWYSFHQQLVLVFNLIIVVTLVPFGWIYLQVDSGRFEPYFSELWIRFVGALFLFGGASWIIWKSYRGGNEALKDYDQGLTIGQKLRYYYQVQIRKFLRYELACVLIVAGMYFFEPLLFAIAYLFVLFVFSLDWPKYDKVVLQMKFTKEDREVLEQKDHKLD
jgi:hypothetical protein